MTDSPQRRRASGRVTLADVARVAGVSPITVSRALRGERAVGAELVAQVRAAAAKLNYLPDPAARALASRRGAFVVVMLPRLSSVLFTELLEAAQATLRKAGLQTLLGVTHHDPGNEEQLLRELLVHRPAGLLVTGFERSAAANELITRSGLPCVHLLETSAAPGLYSVGLSHADAGAAITQHLLGRGCRRVAFAAAELDPPTLRRRDGWKRALVAAGLHDPRLEWLNPAAASLELGGRMFEQIVATRPLVDAIFFGDDELAQGALLAAARLRVAVPQRVAVAGFNDLTGSDQMLPALTTVRTPRAQIGEQAALMLLQLIRGQPVQNNCLDLGYELVLRASA